MVLITSALGRTSWMTSQQDGEYNVAVGVTAGQNVTMIQQNVYIGQQPMYYHGQGDYNVAIGYVAFYDDVSGSTIVAIGTRK